MEAPRTWLGAVPGLPAPPSGASSPLPPAAPSQVHGASFAEAPDVVIVHNVRLTAGFFCFPPYNSFVLLWLKLLVCDGEVHDILGYL